MNTPLALVTAEMVGIAMLSGFTSTTTVAPSKGTVIRESANILPVM